ncbi:MAG TPA: DNA polymerase I [Alphaproteobacteria bacterium]|nr:DNA polymerase I [Alphaproteobacteria bacterium]
MPSQTSLPSGNRSPGAGDHLYLIDGSGYIFRAYHALPPLMRKRDGLPVGAVSGFCNMLYKLIEDTRSGESVTHIAVIFDSARQTFRNEIYPAYKANRDEPPEDLRPQFSIIRDAVRAFNVVAVETPGFEADDLIATYASQAAARGARVTIVSSDKDLMQLVGNGVDMLDPIKNIHIGPDQVFEKFGVDPARVVDVQALAGDASDNVPGIPGIGVKTAAQLIQEYGDLDSLLARAGEIKQPKRRESLIKHAEMARISRQLVSLRHDVVTGVDLDSMVIRHPEPEALLGFLTDMEFNTLARRVAAEMRVEVPSTPVAAPSAGPGSSEKPAALSLAASPLDRGAPGAIRPGLDAPINPAAYETIVSLEALDRWIADAYKAGTVAVDTETDSLDAMRAVLVGVSLSTAPGRACYIPVGHTGPDGEGALSLGGGAPQQLARAEVLARLRPLFEDPGVLKVGQNLKYDMLVLSRYGVRITPIDDTMLLSYALDAGLHGHGMDELSKLHLGHTPISFKEVTGSGKEKRTFDRVPLDKATEYAAEDADVTGRLFHVLKPRLAAEQMTAMYETLERPLAPVLVDMERAGIMVDAPFLARLSSEFAQRMAEYEDQIYALAGEKFNIASPKQLGEILFGKLGMAGDKKTRGGDQSTGADVLELLAAQGHDLPARVIDWRQLSKLRGTYTEALQGHINPETGRVHTSYSMASTSTGRLSSNDPNLQNIPIRTEEGRKLREAFIAAPGHKLISADYSQIELRILAEIANIDALKQAFARGEDIHAITASEMFDVPVKDMDPAIRRRAKAINFGIIYGISAFGLANQLRIPQGEAQRYIAAYFEKFPGIRAYMDATKKTCRDNGFVTTLFGRKIHFPGINQKNPAHRAFSERAAINAPIQGTAADIIRRAMIRIPDALRAAKLTARMLLQVHDELVFEAPDSEVEAVKKLVSQVMEQAALPAVAISVPLTVDAKAGDNWGQAH